MSTRTSRHLAPRITTRHLWLASLGAIAVTRDSIRDGSDRALSGARDLGARAATLAADTGLVLRGGAMTLQEQIDPVASAFRRDARAAVFTLLAMVESPFASAAPARTSATRRAPRRNTTATRTRR